jgi:DUF4097 and DUF4098 domain-containing protein YvlB
MQRLRLACVMMFFVLVPLARSDEWSKTYSVGGHPDLQVETSDANLHVDTWDESRIEVHVSSKHYKIGPGGIQIYEKQEGDRVELELRYPHHFPLTVQIGNARVDVDIHMPREGRVRLHTGDGAIRLTNFKGTMDLESGDGHQDIDAVDGTLRARTGDGSIRAAGRFDGLDLNTGDGRIEARVLPGSSVSSNWTVHTGDGSVTLQLPDNFAADLDLHTSDGHITLDMPVAVEGLLGQNNVRGKINGGGNLLSVHTGDGSIHIEKSSPSI